MTITKKQLKKAILSVGASYDGFIRPIGSYVAICPFCWNKKEDGHKDSCIRTLILVELVDKFNKKDIL